MTNDYSLRSSILVAPPTLLEPPFDESIIILSGHQNDGTVGFILNRPIGLMIQDIFDNHQEALPEHTLKPILFGGPVSKNAGFIMYEHDRDKPLASGLQISPHISISPARKLLDDATEGRLPGRFELLLGHASWNRGQLKRELSRGDWLLTSFNQELIFDVPHEERWQRSFEKMGVAPYAFVQVPGGAQA